MNFEKNLFSLENSNIIITGASSGIGNTLALSLSNLGSNIIGISRTGSGPNKILKKYKCDVTDFDKLSNVFNDIKNKYGQINGLVNCAGISIKKTKNISEIDRFRETLNTNLIGTFNSCFIFSSMASSDKKSSIVNLTSIASEFGFPDNPGYVASKGGVKSLTKSLAIDYAKLNIRVNCLSPGYIHTNMTNESYLNPIKYNERLNKTILNKWGNVNDLVGASIFLLSDASSYITGSEILVDGGWTAKGI
jgi:NAD(P)-dependent dehydrogenase (short-subunit alcohol dehydrogenase family)